MLTSASTYEEVEAEYFNTANYLINESASEARRHAVAIRYLFVMLASNSVKGSNSVSFRVDLLQAELERAEAYAKAMDAKDRNVIRADLRGMRRHG